MSESSLSELLASQLEISKQAQSLLESLTDQQYTSVASELVVSSIGKHMRHILDHYHSLERSMVSGEVDYDLRRRGCEIETSRTAALAQWADVERLLQNMSSLDASSQLTVKSEVAQSSKQVATMGSTLSRELVFVASHAVHHFSLIAIVCQLQGIDLHENFGVAPATATYIRQVAS